jgi:hypothetical protein
MQADTDSSFLTKTIDPAASASLPLTSSESAFCALTKALACLHVAPKPVPFCCAKCGARASILCHIASSRADATSNPWRACVHDTAAVAAEAVTLTYGVDLVWQPSAATLLHVPVALPTA